MNMLFKDGTFDAIMTALYKSETDPGREAEFKAACPASLKPEEKEWLWNYLKHCDGTGTGTGGWKPVPEAASSGW